MKKTLIPVAIMANMALIRNSGLKPDPDRRICSRHARYATAASRLRILFCWCSIS
jgi:hypothetical protein